MASRGAVLLAAGMALAVAAGATAYGLSNRSGSKTAKGKPTTTKTTTKTTPKPPSLIPPHTLKVDGTLSDELTAGTTRLSEKYTLPAVEATGGGGSLEGTYKGSGVKGTFTGTGTQSTLNTTEKYGGSIIGGSISFSLTDNGYGTLSGQGSLSLKCQVTSGTAKNKYGTGGVKSPPTTVVLPIKVTVEGSSATVIPRGKGSAGSLMGTFGASKP